MKPQIPTHFILGVIALIAFIDLGLIAAHLNQQAEGELQVTPVLEEVDANEEALNILLEEFTGELDLEITEEMQEDVMRRFTWPDISFFTQAPYGWTSPWTYYAEEAALAMAMSVVTGEDLSDFRNAAAKMSAIGSWERSNLDTELDTSAEDMLRVVREFYQHEDAYLIADPSVPILLTELDQGGLLLLPINGQLLENPNYGNPGPEHHVLLIYGYTNEGFLVHDPGTVKGEAQTYDFEKTLGAAQDLDGERRAVLIQL